MWDIRSLRATSDTVPDRSMRWRPRGYGGTRRYSERAKQDGWHDQGRLAVSVEDPRLTWPERDLVRQLGDKLYGQCAASPLRPAG